jgi:hypothetical protein
MAVVGRTLGISDMDPTFFTSQAELHDWYVEHHDESRTLPLSGELWH